MKSVATLLDLLHVLHEGYTAVIVPELGIRISYAALRQQVMAQPKASECSSAR